MPMLGMDSERIAAIKALDETLQDLGIGQITVNNNQFLIHHMDKSNHPWKTMVIKTEKLDHTIRNSAPSMLHKKKKAINKQQTSSA